MITIEFTSDINNTSLQVGDLAYYVTPSLLGGFNQSSEAPELIGKIQAKTSNSVTVDNSVTGEVPGVDDFIMFAKDSRINLSGLVGYYAEATFKNNSTEKAEMYSVGSEVTPSSK